MEVVLDENSAFTIAAVDTRSGSRTRSSDAD